MPPSRGRQIETQVYIYFFLIWDKLLNTHNICDNYNYNNFLQIIIRYSGGVGKDLHCRQSILQMNLELLPSVSITHWDVLPAEM